MWTTREEGGDNHNIYLTYSGASSSVPTVSPIQTERVCGQREPQGQRCCADCG